jgi:hypothetical protein
VILAFRVVVVLGFAGVVALAAGNGLDTTGVLIAAIVVALGLTALGAARKIKQGSVSPGECEACGGLVARSAPYCKHCGARRPAL